ncbi:AB-hydrolase YheT [Pilatotrama ljubarskyi]|nr:AB-hydrolase YheT [Pilatotrama ljubarskyi]
MPVYTLLLVGTAFGAIIYGAWRKLSSERSHPFVTLHVSPDSAVLPRSEDGERSKTPPRSLAELVREKVPSLGSESTFKGVWWLPGGHLQTMYCSVGDFTKVDPVVYERKLLQLPDEGIVAVDISPPFTSEPIAKGENVLLVAHGLTGGSHEAYVRALVARVTQSKDKAGLGFRAVVLNFRGCNGTPLVTPRLYHAGSSDDVRHVVLWICHTFPDCRLYGAGFSLGGNILAKYAGEEGDQCPLQALVTLANPWDFLEGSHYLPSTFLGRHVYRYVLGGALRRLLQLHAKVFLEASGLPISRSQLENVLQRPSITLRAWDELITAPLYGFDGPYDYYAKISSSRHVQNIRIPCLAINSRDDPITGSENLPLRQIRECPWVVLAVTRTGGHLGWFERGPDGRIARWYVEPVEQLLGAFVDYGLENRQKPRGVVDGADADLVRQDGRPDVGFRVLSPEQSKLLVSGVEVSKLFSGW